MPEYSNERLRYLRLGISSYTENERVLDVIGNLNISGITTVGEVTITPSGIVTSSNPGVTTVVYYGDGSNLFGVSAFNVVTQDVITTPVYPTFASNTGVTSVGISSSNFVFIPSTGSIGIGTTNPTSKLTVSGGGYFTGVVTASSFSGTATSATALQNSRTFEITGDIVASPVSFDGTGNVSFAATIQPNSVALGTDTTGDYVQSVSGTANEITVTGGTGEGSTPVISISPNPLLPGNVTIANDLQVNNNLNVTGNITIGGTSAYIISNDFRVKDADIVLGYTTSITGNDVSNDTTANHGGIAIASTEGTPLVQLYNVAIGETNPATYKKIMWFKSGAFAGLNTDAWLINYAVGIGSTQFPSGTRLAAGSVQFTENDLAVVRNINASGIITASSFVGSASSLTDVRIGISSGGVSVGTASTINFVGTGVSSVTISSGIATINIAGSSQINTATVRNTSYTVATEGQTIFPCSYTIGYVEVYFNGVKLSPTQYSASDGANVILYEAASDNDIVETVGYNGILKLSAGKSILTDTSADGLTSYTGKAAVGIATTEPYWSIRRSLFSSVGIVTSTGIARNIAWINRTSGIYT